MRWIGQIETAVDVASIYIEYYGLEHSMVWEMPFSDVNEYLANKIAISNYLNQEV